MIVAVRPPGPFPGSSLLRNGIFGDDYVHIGSAGHWLKPYAALREAAAREGITMVTEDMADLAEAAALVIIDLPNSANELIALRKACPNLKLILQTLESCYGRDWTFDPANHRLFDAVVSYNDAHARLNKYFVYKIPAGGIDGWCGPLTDKPWEERRLAAMVASRYTHSPIFPLRTGVGLQLKYGWRLNPSTWLNYVFPKGALYQTRDVVADAMALAAPDEFDIFGPYWEDVSSATTRRCVRGLNPHSKLEFLGSYRFTIAYENCRNDKGYISEKIFDPLLAGSVPVYLGNERIDELIPPEAFVDARQFADSPALAAHLKSVSKARWQEIRSCGSDFLRSGAIARFGAGQYIDAMLAAIRHAIK